MTTKPTLIQIGSKVRSFDFPPYRDLTGVSAHYIEGVVEDIKDTMNYGLDQYSLCVTKIVEAGVETLVTCGSRFVYPVVNGTQTMVGPSDTVELIEGE